MGRNHTRVGLDIGISAEPHPWDLRTRELTYKLSGGLSNVHSEDCHLLSGKLELWHSSSRGGCSNAARGSLFSPFSLSSEPCPATANYKPSRLPHSPPTSPCLDSSSPHFPIKGITHEDQACCRVHCTLHLPLPLMQQMMPLSPASVGIVFALARRVQGEQWGFPVMGYTGTPGPEGMLGALLELP